MSFYRIFKKIPRFIKNWLIKRRLRQNLESAYREMMTEEARELEAIAWSEGLVGDINILQ